MKNHRNTKQRQLVLDAVRMRCDHPSADQIYLDTRIIDEKISRGTVYRNLNILVQQGEIFQVKAPNADRFEAKRGMHYHLLCLECGTVVDSPLPYHEELDEQVIEKTGYTIERHRTVFEGLCTECQQKNLEQNKHKQDI